MRCSTIRSDFTAIAIADLNNSTKTTFEITWTLFENKSLANNQMVYKNNQHAEYNLPILVEYTITTTNLQLKII